MFALREDGLGGGLLEDLGADELGGLDGVVCIEDLGERVGGAFEFGLEGAGLGIDRVESVAYRAAAVGDFGCGELRDFLCGFGVRFEELGEVGECFLDRDWFACFWVGGFDADRGEVCCAESGQDVDAFEGCGGLDVVDRVDD